MIQKISQKNYWLYAGATAVFVLLAIQISAAQSAGDRAPQIVLTKLTSNPEANEMVSLAAGSMDDVKIDSMEIFVDGSSIGKCQIGASRFGVCAKPAGPWAIGTTHAYYATATDSSGQVAKSTEYSFTVQSSTDSSGKTHAGIIAGPYMYETATCDTCVGTIGTGYSSVSEKCESGRPLASSQSGSSAASKNWFFYRADYLRDAAAANSATLKQALSCESILFTKYTGYLSYIKSFLSGSVKPDQSIVTTPSVPTTVSGSGGKQKQRGSDKLVGKRTDTYNIIAHFDTLPSGHYEIQYQYQKDGDLSWKDMGNVISVEDERSDGNDIVKAVVPVDIGISKDGAYNFRVIGAEKELSDTKFDQASQAILSINFVSSDQLIDVGLGPPTVLPSVPVIGSGFQIECPVENPYLDCIDAYSAEAIKCTWRGSTTGDFRDGWDGKNAVFDCPAAYKGEYTAVCKTRVGTPDNCKQASTSATYNVQ